MSLVSYTRSFLDFESRHRLFQLKLKDVPFWDYVRYETFYHGLSQQIKVTPRIPPPTYVRVQNLLKAVGYGIKWFFAHKEVHDVLILNYARRFNLNGKRVNAHTYPIVKKLQEQFRLILIDPSSMPESVERDYPCDVLRLFPFEAIARIRSKLWRLKEKDVEMLKHISSDLKEEMGIHVDLVSVVKQVFFYQLCMSRIYSKLLTIYRPKLILFVDTANHKGLIAAAHEQGIPIIDLQHSLISYLNILYNYPESSYEYVRPTVSDYVLTFSDYWRDQYRLPVKTIPVGFPLFDALREFAQSKVLSTDCSERSMIVISDVSLSRDDFVEMTIELARQLPDWKIYYKLRFEDYAGWQKRYKAFVEFLNIHVIDSDEYPLYSYFSICSYQIGINSTALYEGMAHGLTTFVMKKGLYEEMEQLYEDGLVYLVTSADEVVEILNNDEGQEKRVSKDDFFGDRSLEKINRVCTEIIEGRCTS